MRLAVSLSSLLLLCGCTAVGLGPAGANAVVVRVLDEPLPAEERAKRKFLWETFAHQPEEDKFNYHKVRGWEQRFSVFAGRLIDKAQSQGLDAVSLEQVLSKMLEHADEAAIALLPIGAYQTTLDGRPVWIIVGKWEYPGFEKRLYHIRMLAFDQETLELVGAARCA